MLFFDFRKLLKKNHLFSSGNSRFLKTREDYLLKIRFNLFLDLFNLFRFKRKEKKKRTKRIKRKENNIIILLLTIVSSNKI